MARGIGFFVFDKIGIIGDGIDDAPTIDSLMNLARHQVIDGFGGRGGLRFGVPVGMKFLWYFQGQDFSYAIDRFVLVGAKWSAPPDTWVCTRAPPRSSAEMTSPVAIFTKADRPEKSRTSYRS